MAGGLPSMAGRKDGLSLCISILYVSVSTCLLLYRTVHVSPSSLSLSKHTAWSIPSPSIHIWPVFPNTELVDFRPPKRGFGPGIVVFEQVSGLHVGFIKITTKKNSLFLNKLNCWFQEETISYVDTFRKIIWDFALNTGDSTRFVQFINRRKVTLQKNT